MRNWGKRFFSSTRGQVVKLLRRGEVTVNELAERLEVTDNAVRSHLNTLERDGLVRQAGKRPGVRKPETVYALTPEAEELFPKAYHLLMNGLISALERRLSPNELDKLLRDVGSEIATRTAPTPPARRDARLKHAVEVLNGMGGLAEIDESDEGTFIRGRSCPLAASVEEHPQVCRLAEALLEQILGTGVREVCDRSESPRCAFQIDPAEPTS